MKDISKCVGEACKKRDSCLRYTQPPKERYQHYIHQATAVKNVNECKFYMEID